MNGAVPQIETFGGLTQTAWTAVSAVGTLLIAALTFLTVVFIAFQAFLTRQAFNDSFLEEAISQLQAYKLEMFELRVVRRTAGAVGWAELKMFRSVVQNYDRVTRRLADVIDRTRRSRINPFLSSTLDDIEELLSIAQYFLTTFKNRTTNTLAEADAWVTGAMKQFDASDAEISDAIKLLRSGKSDAFRTLLTAIQTRFFLAKEKTVEEIAALIGDIKTPKDEAELFDMFRPTSIDVNSLAFVKTAIDDLRDTMENLKHMQGRVRALVGENNA